METLHLPISSETPAVQPLRIRYMSDLHIEFGPWLPRPIVGGQDVVVLAGDIHVRENAVRWAKMAFADFEGPVLLVPGNHEYYGGALEYTLGKMKKEAEGSNVHVLSRDRFDYKGVRFLGATMWTDYRLTGSQPLAMFDAGQFMSDFKKIKTPEFTKLWPNRILSEHVSHRIWMENELDKPFEGKTVVITHHLPSIQSITEYFRSIPDHSNSAYASDLSGLMLRGIDLWIHGHNHAVNDYVQDGTRIVSNQRGYYPDQLVREFNPDLIVELPLGV